ncbi:ABC transporter substrate-binding protein [Actinosynnema sp. NPDC020468]|uniref:ABC transporter substrate-binding protein n=1 Tax=Actinosynnema sp. NPDC020468 TaxID=3154488 RepID=UPI0033EE0A30
MRTSRPGTAIAVVAALLLAGCSTPEQAPAAAPTGGGFPVTLHNAYGDVTIPAKPQRIAALGYADVALASALGAQVVVAPQSFGSLSRPDADRNLPYAKPLAADVTWVNPMSVNVEQVAAARPDLILATAAFTLDQAQYEQLGDIAPVVTYEKSLYAATGDESATRIGTALGEVEAAGKLVTAASDAIDEVKKELPNLDGGTYLYGQARAGVVVMLVEDRNVTARFLRRLGLVALPAVAGLGGKGSVPGAVDVSFEQAPLFDDAGVLFMTYQSDALRDAFEKAPTVASRPIMSTRYVPLEAEVATALQDPNVVAVPWLLDRLRPGLALVPTR